MTKFSVHSPDLGRCPSKRDPVFIATFGFMPLAVPPTLTNWARALVDASAVERTVVNVIPATWTGLLSVSLGAGTHCDPSDCSEPVSIDRPSSAATPPICLRLNSLSATKWSNS
jgi:hypothetical protein